MGKKFRFWKSAVCLTLAVMLSCAAEAAEQKGFLIRMWERFRPKEKAGETVPAAPKKVVPVRKETPVPEKPVQVAPVSPESTSSAAAVTLKPEPAVSVGATTEAGQRYVIESKAGEEEIEDMEDVADVMEERLPPEKEGEEPKTIVPLSNDQMIAIIERRLKIFSQLIFLIPDLSVKQSADGTEEYYYAKDGGVALKLKDLDNETLTELFRRVNNEATRLHTERIQKQIQQQEQLMRQIQQSMPQQPVQPPQPPPVYMPPPTPPQPPQVFTPPQPPPRPPEQPRR